jgi:hypothetical protein
MYETVAKHWKDYSNKYSTRWAGNDPRHGLSAEISERLVPLDLILDQLKQALSTITDPRAASGQHERDRQPMKTREYSMRWRPTSEPVLRLLVPYLE